MADLTHAERTQFAAWCESEAHDADALAKQAETLPGMGPVVKRFRLEAIAFTVVAEKLRSIESMEIRSNDIGGTDG